MIDENIDINKIVELRCKTTDYLGVGAIKKISDIAKDLKGRNIGKTLIVTGKDSYKISGAWDYVRAALEENSIEYLVYDQIKPNPTVDVIDDVAQQSKEFGANAIVSIGGGSATDTAKSVAVLTQYPENDARQLYMQEMNVTKALPLVAINLTHGTGTEVNRYAVATIPEKQFKTCIVYDCIYPLYAIDDPELTTKLSDDQTRYVTIDALNHVIEAATTTIRSPYSILIAKETIRLVAKYLPIVLKDPKNLTARYHLLYSSAIAGMSFDCSMLHLTHALEHPLSAMKPEIYHGLGLATILPAVLKAIYPYDSKILAGIYSPLIPDLKGLPSEADAVAIETEAWLSLMGVPQKMTDLGFEYNDISRLVELAFETPILGFIIGLSPTPIESKEQIVRKIYEDSLYGITTAL